MKSSEIARKTYNNIKAEGLKERTNEKRDELILTKLRKELNKEAKIIDLCCGYGRLTIPLAKEGYKIEGIDISEALIKSSKETAKKENLDIKFLIGDICELPYESNRFGIVMCMWSAFNELLYIYEQKTAIKEIKRVLKFNGLAIFEGRVFRDSNSAPDEIFTGRYGRISLGELKGNRNDHYVHDEESFVKILKANSINNYKVSNEKWGGRSRLILRFWKNY